MYRCIKKTVFLRGGLGNQMFQYAFYLSLNARGFRCAIDSSFFSICKGHYGYELNRVFGIREPKQKYSRCHLIFTLKLIGRKLKWLQFDDGDSYFFCENAYRTWKPVFLGYWLSPEYFSDIGNRVRKAFTFKDISRKNRDFASNLELHNSVSLHIRRGDYLLMAHHRYDVCGEHYYSLAIESILKRVTSPVFYVFSDAPLWCVDFMKRFDVDYVIVDWNRGINSYEDMYLMSRCRHNIIANSTFSWWGAWLNANPQKVVVSPLHWLLYPERNINCPGWILIDNKDDFIYD